jgi:hypothetical protein
MSHRRATRRRTGRCEGPDGQYRRRNISNLSPGDLTAPATAIASERAQRLDDASMAQRQLSQLRGYRAIRGVEAALVGTPKRVQ